MQWTQDGLLYRYISRDPAGYVAEMQEDDSWFALFHGEIISQGNSKRDAFRSAEKHANPDPAKIMPQDAEILEFALLHPKLDEIILSRIAEPMRILSKVKALQKSELIKVVDGESVELTDEGKRSLAYYQEHPSRSTARKVSSLYGPRPTWAPEAPSPTRMKLSEIHLLTGRLLRMNIVLEENCFSPKQKDLHLKLTGQLVLALKGFTADQSSAREVAAVQLAIEALEEANIRIQPEASEEES